MIKHIALALLLALVLATSAAAATFGPLGGNPSTTNNDDTCDIGNFPAATLLLPYFEVAPLSTSEDTTIFSVTNTSPLPQAARVTLWTDYAYPVISFNLYLTGYDVQKINLYDVLVRGAIAPEADMGAEKSPVGDLSDDDNPRLDESTCNTLPRVVPQVIITRMLSAFTTGKVPPLGSAPGCNTAGGVHTNAVGYATIDVVGVCTGTSPVDDGYFTHEIRFDNVLMGDYIQVNSDQNYAQASPMVHIRAIPEGGLISNRKKTHLPRTFYSRFQPSVNQTADARQPLPATFAARWISGSGPGFETFYKVWREGRSTSDALCTSYPGRNGVMQFDSVRFDEDENPEALGPCILCNPPLANSPVLPAASLINADNEAIFPPNPQGDVAGWIYLNLNNGSPTVASQNWVVTSMRSEERFSVDIEASALGNGCSPIVPQGDNRTIGPAPNTTP